MEHEEQTVVLTSLKIRSCKLHSGNEWKVGVYICCVHKMRCLLKAQLYYLVRYYPFRRKENGTAAKKMGRRKTFNGKAINNGYKRQKMFDTLHTLHLNYIYSHSSPHMKLHHNLSLSLRLSIAANARKTRFSIPPETIKALRA